MTANASTPAATLLGHRPEPVDGNAGRVRCRFSATPSFCNPLGVVQGGMLMAMLELAMKDAVRAARGAAVPARLLDLQTSFLRSAAPGELFCEAAVTRAGRRTAFVSAELRDPHEAVLATATAVLALDADPA